MKELFITSFFLCRIHHKLLLKSFVGLVLLTVLYSIPWSITGLPSGSGYELLFNLFVGIMELIITVNVINVVSGIIKNKTPENLIYTVPAFFIGSLCYICLTLLGIVFLIIPGLWSLIFLAFVPLAKILSPSEGPFKKSKELVSKSPYLVTGFVILSLMIEFMPTLLEFIPDWQLKLMLNMVISIPWSAVKIVFITAFVRLYYQLEAAPTLNS